MSGKGKGIGRGAAHRDRYQSHTSGGSTKRHYENGSATTKQDSGGGTQEQAAVTQSKSAGAAPVSAWSKQTFASVIKNPATTVLPQKADELVKTGGESQSAVKAVSPQPAAAVPAPTPADNIQFGSFQADDARPTLPEQFDAQLHEPAPRAPVVSAASVGDSKPGLDKARPSNRSAQETASRGSSGPRQHSGKHTGSQPSPAAAAPVQPKPAAVPPAAPMPQQAPVIQAEPVAVTLPTTIPMEAPAPPPAPAMMPTAVPSSFQPTLTPMPMQTFQHTVPPVVVNTTAPTPIPQSQPPPPAPQMARSHDSSTKSQQHPVYIHGGPGGFQGGRVVPSADRQGLHFPVNQQQNRNAMQYHQPMARPGHPAAAMAQLPALAYSPGAMPNFNMIAGMPGGISFQAVLPGMTPYAPGFQTMAATPQTAGFLYPAQAVHFMQQQTASAASQMPSQTVVTAHQQHQHPLPHQHQPQPPQQQQPQHQQKQQQGALAMHTVPQGHHGGMHVNHHQQTQHAPASAPAPAPPQQAHNNAQVANVSPLTPAVHQPTAMTPPAQPPPRKALQIKDAHGIPLDLHDVKKVPGASTTETPAPKPAPAKPPPAEASSPAAPSAAAAAAAAAASPPLASKPVAGSAARAIKAPPPDMRKKPQPATTPSGPAVAVATVTSTATEHVASSTAPQLSKPVDNVVGKPPLAVVEVAVPPPAAAVPSSSEKKSETAQEGVPAQAEQQPASQQPDHPSASQQEPPPVVEKREETQQPEPVTAAPPSVVTEPVPLTVAADLEVATSESDVATSLAPPATPEGRAPTQPAAASESVSQASTASPVRPAANDAVTSNEAQSSVTSVTAPPATAPPETAPPAADVTEDAATEANSAAAPPTPPVVVPPSAAKARSAGVAPAPVTAPATVAAAASVVAAPPPTPAPETPAQAVGKGKKNLKDIMKKADAIDDLSSRVDPFAAPPKATAAPPLPSVREQAPASQKELEASVTDPPAGSAEESTNDNWEEAAEHGATPPVSNVVSEGGSVDASGRRAYTRDFLKSLSRFNDRPLEIDRIPYASELLLDSPRMFESSDLVSMGSGAMGRRGGGGGGGGGVGAGPGGGAGGGRQGDDWGARRGPGGGQYQPQDLRMGGRNVASRTEGPRMPVDRRASQQSDDKWERRGPVPMSPGGGGGGGRADNMLMTRVGSGMLHRTDKRFVAGQSMSSDPEEEKRQKQFQGILNKITPDNFERLTHKIVCEVGIVEQRTLQGLIDKIFDKALTDTHFCELYATMVKSLSENEKCPKFPPADGVGKPIDLRRLLLYKCQEEFEKGSKAMQDVEAAEAKEVREGTAAQESKEAGDGTGAGNAEELEEGEIVSPRTATATTNPEGAAAATEGDAAPKPPPTATELKLAERAKADADRAARRRMLGNIQFISYLYKMGLLTERILHSCILTLLREQENPRPEDLECLCKLMMTVGKQLDSTNKIEHRNGMLTYFARLTRLRENKNLESRIRFMIQDVLDLKANNWQPRNKKEGPKKIEEIHREAQHELNMQQQRDRDERQRDRRGGGGGGGDRYSGAPPPSRSSNTYDRLLPKDEVPSRPMVSMNRATSQELSFRPGSAFSAARGAVRTASPSPAAASNAASAAIAAAAASGRSQPSSQQQQAQAAARTATQPSPPPPPARLSVPDMRRQVTRLVEEFHTNCCKLDVMLAGFSDLRQHGADMTCLLQVVAIAALERRGVDFPKRLSPFEEVFRLALSKPLSEGGVSPEELEAGACHIAKTLHIIVDDQPKAPSTLGQFLALFVASGHVSLQKFLSEVLAVPPVEDGEDSPLVEAGDATDLVFSLMKKLVELKGEAEATSLWKRSGMELAAFYDTPTRKQFEKSPEDIRNEALKAGLSFLVA